MPALVRRDVSGVVLPGSWKKAIELTSSPEASAIQTLALLDSRREQRDHDRQRPGFLPALREPVGPHQAPEAAHRGNRRQRRGMSPATTPCVHEA